MAVPKKRTSSSRRDKRRANDRLNKITISFDKNTGEAKLPHHMSGDGMYNGIEVIKKVNKAKGMKKDIVESWLLRIIFYIFLIH